MAFRSYMLTKLHGGLEREKVVSAVRSIEALPEVVFCEPVIGAYDLIATVETDLPIEETVRRIQGLEQVEDIVALKVNPLPARDRMWKNFKSIPITSSE